MDLLPVDALMTEHRLIEHIVGLIKKELETITELKYVDPQLIDVSVDFLRTYGARCHEAKEERILFRDLARKQLSDEHLMIIEALVKDHAFMRNTVSSLKDAKELYDRGKTESLKDIEKFLRALVELYPLHIEKEDKHFFYPSMGYFTEEELNNMLQEFREFDRKLIHEKYKEIVDSLGHR